MKMSVLQQALDKQDAQGRYVFTRQDVSRLFEGETDGSLAKSLARALDAGVLKRACQGVYVNPRARSFDAHAIEQVAKALRPGEYNYVSLESALSEYGLISQLPIDRLTVMTTGRKGVIHTLYGVIEFTHTKRPAQDLLDGLHSLPGRPLRIASAEAAMRDLRRCGRNIHLLLEGMDHGDRL
jgi:predicted transcriptional regulator of viral defense system